MSPGARLRDGIEIEFADGTTFVCDDESNDGDDSEGLPDEARRRSGKKSSRTQKCNDLGHFAGETEDD